MYTVYAIYNKNCGKIYIGQCSDLEKRLAAHNQKLFNGSYTSRFDGDWEVIYKETASNRQQALNRERELKSFRGRQFIKSHIPR